MVLWYYCCCVDSSIVASIESIIVTLNFRFHFFCCLFCFFFGIYSQISIFGGCGRWFCERRKDFHFWCPEKVKIWIGVCGGCGGGLFPKSRTHTERTNIFVSESDRFWACILLNFHLFFYWFLVFFLVDDEGLNTRVYFTSFI